MEKDGTWGDHVILFGTANYYKTYIDVISSQSNHRDITIRPDGHVMSTNPLVLGHVHEAHYVSLQPKQGEASCNTQFVGNLSLFVIYSISCFSPGYVRCSFFQSFIILL